jgi:hypothetical protein
MLKTVCGPLKQNLIRCFAEAVPLQCVSSAAEDASSKNNTDAAKSCNENTDGPKKEECKAFVPPDLGPTHVSYV